MYRGVCTFYFMEIPIAVMSISKIIPNVLFFCFIIIIHERRINTSKISIDNAGYENKCGLSNTSFHVSISIVLKYIIILVIWDKIPFNRRNLLLKNLYKLNIKYKAEDTLTNINVIIKKGTNSLPAKRMESIHANNMKLVVTPTANPRGIPRAFKFEGTFGGLGNSGSSRIWSL